MRLYMHIILSYISKNTNIIELAFLKSMNSYTHKVENIQSNLPCKVGLSILAVSLNLCYVEITALEIAY